MTVKTMLMYYSYIGKVLIVSSDNFSNEYVSTDDLKNDALFYGENCKIRSELYKYVLDMEVRNFYCDICEHDTTLVIVTRN